MTSTIKNIIIFIVIAAALILAYIFFFKQAPAEPPLTSSSANPVLPTGNEGSNPSSNQDFLSVLLNVKNIGLNDNIFSDPAFASLRDTSVNLTPDGTEGRPNPFAPFGSDLTATSINALNTNTQTPANIIPRTIQ